MEFSQKVAEDRKEGTPAAREGGGCCHDPATSCKIAEIALLCVVMVVIWVSLALPVVFFYVPASTPSPPQPPSCPNGTCMEPEISSGSGEETAALQDEVAPGPSEMICRDHFFLLEAPNMSVCLAGCPSWRQYPDGISEALDKVVLVCACIGVLSSCAVLMISFVRRKHICVFPSVFIVYLTLTLLIQGVFFVINFTDRAALFCRHQDLTRSTSDPTVFCIIAGIIFYYTLFQMTLWWFFHIAALFWGFRFPFNYRFLKRLKRLRYIHLTCLVLGLVLPVIPVAVPMVKYAVTRDPEDPRSAKGLGFGITNFPPVLCAGVDRDATFYALILPVIILTEIGMTMLVFTFWDVRKTHTYGFKKIKKDHRKASMSTRRISLGSGEKKIIIVLLYYVLLVEFALMAFTLTVRNVGDFRAAVVAHFRCEATGFNPDDPCDRSSFEDIRYPSVSLLAYMLLLLFPVINFTFVINFRGARKWLCKHVLKSEETSSTNAWTGESVGGKVRTRAVTLTGVSAIDHAGDKSQRDEARRKMFSSYSVDLPMLDRSPYLKEIGENTNLDDPSERRMNDTRQDSRLPRQTAIGSTSSDNSSPPRGIGGTTFHDRSPSRDSENVTQRGIGLTTFHEGSPMRNGSDIFHTSSYDGSPRRNGNRPGSLEGTHTSYSPRRNGNGPISSDLNHSSYHDGSSPRQNGIGLGSSDLIRTSYHEGSPMRNGSENPPFLRGETNYDTHTNETSHISPYTQTTV